MVSAVKSVMSEAYHLVAGICAAIVLVATVVYRLSLRRSLRRPMLRHLFNQIAVLIRL